MTEPTCRLFVITASNAPKSIIIRRGPSKWYHLLKWRMDKDTFEPGAWFHGRIYEEKCDLSPDGNLLVYFCHGGAWRPEYTDSWTAVSRAPWLYALALWPSGTTYGGDGRFIDNRSLVLCVDKPAKTHPDHPATGLKVVKGSVEYRQPVIEVDDADWSGRDHEDNMIFCRGGKLFRCDHKSRDHEIADFSDLRPDPKPAPDWAKKPLIGGRKR